MINLKPKILVHICCAICGVAMIGKLKEKFEVVLFYYNPNIWPADEYERRKESVMKMAEIYEVEFISAQGGPAFGWEWEHENWKEKISGKENEPERGSRCYDCFEMRLQKTAELAKTLGIENFTTTLFVSPFKDENQVNTAGKKMADKFGLNYLQMQDVFLDKAGNWKETRELSKKYNFYFQKYCGCKLSKR